MIGARAVMASTTPVATAMRAGMSQRGGRAATTAADVERSRRRVRAKPTARVAMPNAKVGSADQCRWASPRVLAAKTAEPAANPAHHP